MIPMAQLEAAEIAGRLMAERKINGLALLPHLVTAARRTRPTLDPRGTRTRLAHIMGDSARAHRAAVVRHSRAIRRAVRTLLDIGMGRRAVIEATEMIPGVLNAKQREFVVLEELVHKLRGRS